MLKKALTGVIAGAAMLTMVGTASATVEVNLYGASAQYKFWTAAAPEFLAYSGCANTDIYVAKGSVSSRDNGIAICAGSDAVTLNGSTISGSGMSVTDVNNNTTTGNTVIFRYSTNASYDGVLGIQDDDTYSPDTATCSTAGDRLMADPAATTIADPYDSTDSSTIGTVAGTECYDVNIGASDVAAETFNQHSEGLYLGHRSTQPVDFSVEPPLQADGTIGDWTIRDFSGLTIDTSSSGDYDADRPLVVPFAFFANSSVPFTNITRLMAVTIFSGQVSNWYSFDSSVDLPMVVCYRHAGSGTHATLDAAVMRGDASLLAHENNPNDTTANGCINCSGDLIPLGLLPKVWFNNGSSDEIKCVNENAGGIGYADSDKIIGSTSYPDTFRTLYQGEEADKVNIKNGLYDFWSAQWLYSKKAGVEDDAVKGLINGLASYASVAANLPASKADYWATQNEMYVEKATDTAYPTFKGIYSPLFAPKP